MNHRPDVFLTLVVLLLVVFVAQGIVSIQTYSQTYDEAVHIVAGYSYWATGDFRLNHEHPPLTKLIAALPVYLFFQPDIAVSLFTDGKLDQWDLGKRLLYESGESADAMLNAARLTNLLLGASLVGLIARWTFRLGGRRTALVATGLAAFDPTLVAHSSLATTDVGVSLFFFAAFYCVWEFSAQSRIAWLMSSGVCLGLALASKFNAIIAIPLLIAMVAFRSTRLIDVARHAMVLLAVSTLVVLATYFGAGAHHWIEGLRFQLEHQDAGHSAFFLGAFSDTGWPHYFPMAMAMKIPLGSLILFVISLALNAWKRLPAASIVPPLLLLASGTCATTNMGVRYMLPIFPFVFLIGGMAFHSVVSKKRSLVGGLGIATIASSTWCLPHGLAYFNETIGGPSRGINYLADSNLDWGQGLRLLRSYVETHDVSVRSCYYFGTAPPQYYLGAAAGRPDHGKRQVIVVSAHEALFNNRDLSEMKALAHLGYSLTVYAPPNISQAQDRRTQTCFGSSLEPSF